MAVTTNVYDPVPEPDPTPPSPTGPPEEEEAPTYGPPTIEEEVQPGPAPPPGPPPLPPAPAAPTSGAPVAPGSFAPLGTPGGDAAAAMRPFRTSAFLTNRFIGGGPVGAPGQAAPISGAGGGFDMQNLDPELVRRIIDSITGSGGA